MPSAVELAAKVTVPRTGVAAAPAGPPTMVSTPVTMASVPELPALVAASPVAPGPVASPEALDTTTTHELGATPLGWVSELADVAPPGCAVVRWPS